MARIGRTAPVSSFLVDQPTPVYKQLALQLNTPGTFAFKVPAGVNFVDVVLIGGGGGGIGGGISVTSGGGTAGSWAWRTLAVGVTIQTGSVITLTVGSGGAGGGIFGGGANGTASTATASGWAGLTASGGVSNGPTLGGASPGNLTFDYHTFIGGSGGGVTVGGNAPGGGGGGGYNYFAGGGSGASGAAWIYTYTNVDVPPQGLSQMPMSSAVGMARL